MEDSIDLYQRPSYPKVSVTCMEEQSLQLIEEIRKPLPMAPNHPERHDYQHQRKGTVAAFLFTEPLNNWRRVEYPGEENQTRLSDQGPNPARRGVSRGRTNDPGL